jgi:hypothetical protein
LRDELADQPVHGCQTAFVNVHQRDLAAVRTRNQEHVVHESRREAAAGAEHGDLD